MPSWEANLRAKPPEHHFLGAKSTVRALRGRKRLEPPADLLNPREPQKERRERGTPEGGKRFGLQMVLEGSRSF